MSGYARAMVQDALGNTRQMRPGDGFIGNMVEAPIVADTNQTLTAAQIAGGLITHAGKTASRTDTTDTAANIAAAFPNMDVGDSFEFIIASLDGFTVVVAGGTNVTARGNLTVLANANKTFILTKTAGGATPTFGLLGL